MGDRAVKAFLRYLEAVAEADRRRHELARARRILKAAREARREVQRHGAVRPETFEDWRRRTAALIEQAQRRKQ